MASISIAEGKFAVYRTKDTSGANPVTEIIAETDGGTCSLQDSVGKIWIFRCYDGKLEYRKSSDVIGDSFGSWVEIIGADISDGIPAALQYDTTVIEVDFYKTDDKFYRVLTKDYGNTWEAEEEIVTA